MKTHQNLKNITTDASIEEIQYVENVGLNSNSYEAIPEAAKTSKHVQKKAVNGPWCFGSHEKIKFQKSNFLFVTAKNNKAKQ